MNNKIYVKGCILIETPYFKYKNADSRRPIPPEGSNILIQYTSNLLSKRRSMMANMYSQILKFLDEIYSQFGIKPQIIISDYADNLALDSYIFEDYVKARWRNKSDGLIDISILTNDSK